MIDASSEHNCTITPTNQFIFSPITVPFTASKVIDCHILITVVYCRFILVGIY